MKDSAFTNRPSLFPSTLEKARDYIIFPKLCVQPASFVPPFRLFDSLSSREAEIQWIQEPTPRPSPPHSGEHDSIWVRFRCKLSRVSRCRVKKHSRDCLPGEQKLPCFYRAQLEAYELPKQGLNQRYWNNRGHGSAHIGKKGKNL